MTRVEEALSRLPERHQAALRWFAEHAGHELPWPASLTDGTLLASKAKGIYKPSWTRYALSVRESLRGSYPDRDPETRSDGTWSYDYFQENSDPDQRDSEYTNVGLVQCMGDGVPVGVFRQVQRKPAARYHILGVAAVVGWEAGYFHLEGYSADGRAYGRRSQAVIGALVEMHERAVSDEADSYQSLEDRRDRVVASIVRRRGQPEFRRALLEAYGGRCAISGCDAEAALEACHIRPYRGPETSSLSNGLLLRADLHTLFDLGLLSVDTASMTAVVAPELGETTYDEVSGKPVFVPSVTPADSNVEALGWHRGWSGI